MRSVLSTTLIVTSVLITGPATSRPPTIFAQTQPAKAGGVAKSLERSSCVLAIRGGIGGSRDLDIQTVSAALTSSAIVDAAVAEVLGLKPEQWPAVVSLELAAAGQQAVKLSVSVSPDAKAPERSSRRLMENLVARVIRTFAATEDPSRSEFEKRRATLQERQSQLERELPAVQRELDEAMRRLRSPDAGSLDPDPVVLEEEVKDKRVRLEVIESTFAGLRQARKPLVDAAAALLKEREAVVASLESAGPDRKASEQDMTRARAEVAEAKLRVVELGLDPALDIQNRWFDTVLQMRSDIASLERRIERLKATGPTSRPSRVQLQADQDRLSRLASEKQREMQIVSNDLEQLRREMSSSAGRASARLVVLDGAGGAEQKP